MAKNTAQAEENDVEETTEAASTAVAEKPAKAPRPKKPSLFEVNDTVMTPQGEATVIEVHGRGWVKVDGVPKAWHKTEDLEELNPEAAAKLRAALAEIEAKRVARGSTGSSKIDRLKERLVKAEARQAALAETITKIKADIEAAENPEAEAETGDDNEGSDSDE